MSVEATKAPKKRGRPAKAKRHDVDDAPIDGDFRKDVIVNRDPTKQYFLASDDDMPKYLGQGAIRTPRHDGTGARPIFDVGTDPSCYKVDGLTQLEMPLERHRRIVAAEQRRATERTSAMESAARQSGGQFDRENVR